MRTTEAIAFGNPSARAFTTEAERRLHADAVGALTKPKMTPPFAWLVGEKPTFQLEVLEPVDRELTLFVANAMLRPQRLTVVFNGNLLGSIELPVANRQVAETFAVPANVQRRGPNVVEVRADTTEMRRLVDEPVPLPLAAILNRAEFLRPGETLAAERPEAPGLRLGDDGRPRVVLPAGSALRAGMRVPDAERVVLDVDLRSDVPFEIAVRASLAPRRVLVDGAAGAGRHRLDVSRWAGRSVVLEIWARDAGEGALTIERGGLLVDEVDAPSGEASRPEPRGTTSPGGQRATTGERPSFLFVVLDSLARDRTSTYGDERPTTPHLDELAARGWVATDVRASASYTLTSVATMLTGQEPLTHGVTVLPSADSSLALADDAPRLAAELAQQGWRTAGWVANANADSRYGYAEGFEHWEDLHDDPDVSVRSIVDGRHIPPRVGGWLADLEPDEPFFAYAHVFEPHAPYDAPDAFRARFVEPGYVGPVDGSRTWINDWKAQGTTVDAAGWEHLAQLYAARVSYADDVLGQLLDELERTGRADDTIVVVTSDHGEALGEHGAIEHGDLVYDEQIVVPLVVAVPGWESGRIDAPATLSDVAPTLLGLAGIDAPDAMDGVDLFAAPLDADRPRLSRSYARLPVVALTRGRYKLVYDVGTRQRRLFDLVDDPDELVDLSGTREAETLALFADVLRAFHEADPAATRVATSAEDLERLEQMGYVAGTGDAATRPIDDVRDELRARQRRH